jgi:threonine dehydrogenase-like Zn-dependent dehydrogenase
LRSLEIKENVLTLNSDVRRPDRAEGEILVRVGLAGICGTDLELMKGYMGFEGIPGHEFVGVVVEDDGDDWVGKRVVSEINCSCADCSYCRSSMREHCPNRSVIGIDGRPGAFADFISVPSANVHLLPENIPDQVGALIEPFAAALKAIDDGDIRSDHEVAVLGDGCLGLMVTMAAARTGCRPILVGKHPEKMKIVEAEGICTRVLKEFVTEDHGSRFDRVIDCTGNAEGLEMALGLVHPRGKVVMKTTIAGETRVSLSSLVINEVELIGSRCGDFSPAIEMVGRGEVPLERLISRVYELEQWEEAFMEATKRETLKVLFRIG